MKLIFKHSIVFLIFFNFILNNFASAQQLRLLTLNVKLFPYKISKDNKTRAKLLVDIIKQRHEEFDVIAIQELWASDMREYVSKNIIDLYPHQLKDKQSGAWRVGVNSGLSIFSKYAIKRNIHFTYTHYRGDENLARKGGTGVELDVDGKSAYIFTTHLQADINGSYLSWLDNCTYTVPEIRESQLKEMKDAIDGFVVDLDAPTFLVGDFNIVGGSDDYKNALGILRNAIDTFDPESKEKGSSWSDYPSSTRIDYIMVLGRPVQGLSQIINYFGPSVTDHLGVAGTFNF